MYFWIYVFIYVLIDVFVYVFMYLCMHLFMSLFMYLFYICYRVKTATHTAPTDSHSLLQLQVKMYSLARLAETAPVSSNSIVK